MNYANKLDDEETTRNYINRATASHGLTHSSNYTSSFSNPFRTTMTR